MAEKILWNADWMFHRGEIETKMPPYKGAAYMQAKTERMLTGPAAYAYNDRANDYRTRAVYTEEKWERVELPHDYVLLQEPSAQYNCGLGYFLYENAWYRKHFSLCEADRGKRLALYFEGVATRCEVFVNGCPVLENDCGYTSFEVDISDFVWFDRENVVAVHVMTDRHESWWYEGGGICRSVFLKKSDPLHIALYGVYVCPERLADGRWRANFTVTVENGSRDVRRAGVRVAMRAPDGKTAASASAEVSVAPFAAADAVCTAEIESPALWDLQTPNLYTVTAEVFEGGRLCDTEQTRTGLRTFSATKAGFFLNGKKVKIKGVCAHEDFGLCGRAVPENIHRHKVKMLKEMGANGYRASHYPQSEALMDALDEQGFIVMAETRHFTSSASGIRQLEMLIRRDRNRPSVFFWSLGNEEPRHRTDEGVRMFRRMRAAVERLDRTRLITSAVSAPPDQAPIMAELDVIGVNYNLHLYDAVRRLYPDKPIVATETCATGTTRGWYLEDSPERGYLSAYDKDTDTLFRAREYSWKAVAQADDVLGCYQWNGFEHRGECLWPRLCSQSGAIDLFLQKKDAFYQNLSHWSKMPMLHMLPHMNLPFCPGEPVRVVVYTNCEEAELFLGGQSLGRRRVETYSAVEWQAPYSPQPLRAVGYIGGRAAASDERRRTGHAVRLRLRLENEPPRANGRDIALVSCFAEDKDGYAVPDAAPLVSFSCSAHGRIVGTGSDVCDHSRVDLPVRRMRAGVVTAAVRVGKTAGVLRVYAEADGLCGDTLEIPVGAEEA